MDLLKLASSQGYHAYMLGQTLDACPRDVHPYVSHAWKDGWREACNDHDIFAFAHITEEL